MILWMPSSSHPSFDLPNFSFYLFWQLEAIHIHGLKLNCCTLCLNGGGRSSALLLVCFHRCETLPCVFSEPRKRCHRDFKWLFLLIPGTSQRQFQINWLFQGQSSQALLPYTTKVGSITPPSWPLPRFFEDILMKVVLYLFSVAYTLRESSL